MSSVCPSPVRVAIACGGTGGHLFPGLAVASQLVLRGCEVILLISAKDVDQQAVKGISGMEVVTLPAVGLARGAALTFVREFLQSYRTVARLFRSHPAQVVLGMGGFTSAPPILAGKLSGARTFLHESNVVPGRANRWLSRLVDGVFVGFPAAAGRLRQRNTSVTGTPVRSCFQVRAASACRRDLGLDPARPVLLVMGGSQGARGINQLVLESLPLLTRQCSDWQWVHLTGPGDVETMTQAYAAAKAAAKVHAFFAEMEVVLGAATAALCRAGASSLAELAAMRLPAVLIPYPAAVDNHQFHNARAFEATGAAYLLEQKAAGPAALVQLLLELVEKPAVRQKMQSALGLWHAPRAAQDIAEAMLAVAGAKAGRNRRARKFDQQVSPEASKPSPPARMQQHHAPVRHSVVLARRGV